MKAPKGPPPYIFLEWPRFSCCLEHTFWFRLLNRLLSCRYNHRSLQSVTDQVQKTDGPLNNPATAPSGSDASLLRADCGHAREKLHSSITNVCPSGIHCPLAQRKARRVGRQGAESQVKRAFLLTLCASLIWGFYKCFFHELVFIICKKIF